MRVNKSSLRIAAGQLASDADLCKMFALSEKQLETHRELIEQARAAAMVYLKLDRARTQARRGGARREA